jgi:hypothetical protein
MRSTTKASLMSCLSASASEIFATRIGNIPFSRKDGTAREFCGGAEFFFDA